MATSSENSDQVLLEDERRLKRKLSNRESARRSRKRKQLLVEDLTAEISRLQVQNSQIMAAVNASTSNFMSLDGQNSVLRAQVAELSQRLESLNSISSQMNAPMMRMMNQSSMGMVNAPMYGNGGGQNLQVPIVASAAMFQY